MREAGKMQRMRDDRHVAAFSRCHYADNVCLIPPAAVVDARKRAPSRPPSTTAGAARQRAMREARRADTLAPDCPQARGGATKPSER